MDCAVKKGFFMLRDCRAAADAKCHACSRPCCPEHARSRGQELLCVECYHRDATAVDPSADETWTYAFRHQFYRDSGYHPLYSGSHPDPYYDAYDLRAFSVEGQELGEDDDDPADLADS